MSTTSSTEIDGKSTPSVNRVRDLLAIVIVMGFVVITAVLALVFPVFGLAPAGEVIGYLKDVASIYTGIVGLIVGYYFGKQ